MGHNVKYQLTSQKEAAHKSWEKFQRNRTAEWGLSGIDTGHHYLNMIIGGWQPDKLTVIAARSGVGKTAVTTQMFQSGGRILQGRRPEYLFFTWEMSPDYLVDRHVSHEAGVTYRQMTQGARLLSDSTLERIRKAYDSADSLPVQYQTMSLNIDEIRPIVHSFAEQCAGKSQVEGIEVQPVVIIDYIGMAIFDKYGPRTYGIQEFINGCKQLANQTGAAMCVFSQINRTADVKEMPSKSDISDSQSIEQASDNLILLHRPEHHKVKTFKDPNTGYEIESDGKIVVRVEKCRDSEISDLVINTDIRYYRFWDEGMHWNEAYWDLYSDPSFWIDHFGLADGSQLKVV